MCVLSCNPRLSRCVPEPQCRPGLNYSGWVSGPNNTRTARDTLQSGYWSAVQTSIPHVYLFLRYIRFGLQPTKNEVARALRSAMPIPGVVLSRRLLSPRACSLIRNRVLCLPARKNNVLALLALSLRCQRCVYRWKRGPVVQMMKCSRYCRYCFCCFLAVLPSPGAAVGVIWSSTLY